MAAMPEDSPASTTTSSTQQRKCTQNASPTPPPPPPSTRPLSHSSATSLPTRQYLGVYYCHAEKLSSMMSCTKTGTPRGKNDVKKKHAHETRANVQNTKKKRAKRRKNEDGGRGRFGVKGKRRIMYETLSVAVATSQAFHGSNPDPWVGSGGFQKLADRVGSGQRRCSKFHGSGGYGSGGVSKSHGSVRVTLIRPDPREK